MMQKCVVVLGRRDEPTDAIEEYCRYLGQALTAHGFALEISHVAWKEDGWAKALRELRNRARDWNGTWVLLQYTALSWSKRGFPLRLLGIIKILRDCGARVGIVYHDVEPFGGRRIVDRLRRRSQLRTMRIALQKNVGIFTVPIDIISWRPSHKYRHAFIPVGANFPEPGVQSPGTSESRGRVLTVAVFGVTGGANGRSEILDITEAMRFAAQEVGDVRLVVFGRNSEAAEKNCREPIRGTPVELRVLGVLPPEDVAKTLMGADVLLFVRGEISTRRGSAIAGIACGLPIVAFAGAETAAPITHAGLALYSREKPGDLGRVLVKVLKDMDYRASLAGRSRAAYKEYFSWEAIAARYAELLSEKS